MVCEQNAFVGDAIDVGRRRAGDAVRIRAQIAPADIIAPDHQNVRFLVCHNLFS